MQQADISFINEPYYIVAIPEYKSEHDINLHVYRYDIPGRGWKSFSLKYPNGTVQLKDAVDTSYLTVPHTDGNTEFKPLKPVSLNVEKNIFQIKGPKVVEDTRANIISDITRMLQIDFNIQRYTLEEFEELLQGECDEDDFKKRTLKAFQDVMDPTCKEDIARYYLLYTRGGVYLDPRAILKKRLTDSYFRLNLYDGFIVISDNSQSIPELNLMAFKKGSRLIKDVLEKAVTNVEQRLYGSSSQQPTGALCFRECLIRSTSSPILPRTAREIRYGDEKIFILRQEAGRLYDDLNKPLWNRDVCSNTFSTSLTGKIQGIPNFWLHCNLYPDGNCYSYHNWQYYMSESTQAQYIVVFTVAGILLLGLIYFYFH